MKYSNLLKLFFSIYQVHDEVKDRMFELELSWVGQRKLKSKILIKTLIFLLVTEGKHERVPTNVFDDAEKFAKVNDRIY